MPKIWTQWLHRVSDIVQSSASHDALPQKLNSGSEMTGPQHHSKPQPSWLTPAYLRQRRSGDRISR